jgi:hypothetical protein
VRRMPDLGQGRQCDQPVTERPAPASVSRSSPLFALRLVGRFRSEIAAVSVRTQTTNPRFAPDGAGNVGLIDGAWGVDRGPARRPSDRVQALSEEVAKIGPASTV